MIKFFRRIRQNLLAENKISKYLIYAIGEVVLVMIGILLALQVNNWNEDRKCDREEQDILSNLKQEFQISLQELKEKNSSRTILLECNKALTKIISNKDFRNTRMIDSLLMRTLIIPTYNGKTGALDQIINSGKFNLLKDEDLKERLLAWAPQVEELTEDEVSHVSFIWREYVPFLRPYVRFNEIIMTTGPRIRGLMVNREGSMTEDYEGLLSDPLFENLLYEIEFFAVIGTLGTKKLIQMAEKTLDLIDENLDVNMDQ